MEIENISISIEAKAQKANSSIDALVSRLDVLSKSLGKINGTNLNNFSSGMKTLSDGMNNFKNLKMPDFTRTAKGIKKFEEIDSSKLSNVANVLSPLTDGIKTLGNTSFDNKGMQNLINSLTRLSNANISNLSGFDFEKLGFSINKLALSLKDAPKIQQSVISMTNAIANLSESGQNMPIVTSQLGGLGDSLKKFMTNLSSAPMISENTIAFSQAIASLSNAGSKAGLTASNLSALGVGLNNLMTTLSKAPKVSENVIRMTNALANLSAQGAKIGSASNSISKGLNRASNSATRAGFSFRSLASVFGSFYANAFLLIRGVKGIVNAIDSTADYLEAYNYFNVALGKVGSDWAHQWETYAEEIGVSSAEEYADSFATRLKERLKSLSGLQINIDDEGGGLLTETGLQNLGLNIQEVTQYASQLASVTNSVGQVGEVSLATASSLTKLGADLSSLFNLDYSDVMANLQSGLIGQSRALYKYGIDITNATLQTYAYDLALNKSVSEMTQMEKMQLRLLAILDQSKVSWGDLANTINSPSNMMRQFSNNAKELGMVLGQLFIPALQKVMPVVNGATIALKNLLVSLANLLGIKLDLDSFGQGFSDLEEDADGLAGGLDDVAKSAKKAYMGLLGFDKLNVIKTNNATTSGTGSGKTNEIDLTKEILEATEDYEKAFEEALGRMENLAQSFADSIQSTFNSIWTGFGKGYKADANLVVDSFEEIKETISNIGNDTGVKNSISNFKERFAEMFGAGFGSASSVGGSLLGGSLSGISAALGKEEEYVKQKTTNIFNNLAEMSEDTTGIFEGIAEVGTSFESKGFQRIVALISDLSIVVGTGVLDKTIDFFTRLYSLLTRPFSENAERLSGTFERLFNILSDLMYPLTIVTDKLGIKFSEDSSINRFFEVLENVTTSTFSLALEGINAVLDAIIAITDYIPKAIDLLQDFTGLYFDFKPMPILTTGSSFNKMGARNVTTGKFSESGLFFSDNTDLLGRFNRSKTSVSSGQSVTDDIRQSAYLGIKQAMSESGGTNVTFQVEGDPNGLFKVVRREARDYSKRTGGSAFN